MENFGERAVNNPENTDLKNQPPQGTDKTENAVDPTPMVYAADEVIDIQQIVRIFVRWSWLIVLFALIGAGKGINDAHKFSPANVARMVVSPIESGGGGGGAGGSAGGGRALQAVFSGLKLDSGGKTSKFDEIMYLSGTITFARLMDEKYGLLRKIYKGGWDADKQVWRRPEGQEFELREEINKYLNLRTWSPPTLEDLARFIGGSFRSELLEDASFYEITVKSGDAKFALWLLKTVFAEATNYLREQEEKNLRVQRQFVMDKLAETKIVDFRGQLLQTLENIDRKEMLSTGGLPFAAKVIDPPYISKYKTQPSTVKTIGIPAFGMGLLGAVLILIVSLYRGESRRR
jgi:hypothetical protein